MLCYITYVYFSLYGFVCRQLGDLILLRVYGTVKEIYFSLFLALRGMTLLSHLVMVITVTNFITNGQNLCSMPLLVYLATILTITKSVSNIPTGY